ncbi:MAG: hypothetical protein P0Y56_15270 [Candidatus Andeanibacterium colombiense]|uniref:PhoD-like phosphatase metallophosphatase domain-containing protein n=1 Tax=Candidatus Andeanibacterium colombiense TaxID=3121345 RepID=A0AAJ5X950_9SPHN|nr:MAG: hypothetical protein P0Y56_15270 [Sphingomonadaceae bacterium]
MYNRRTVLQGAGAVGLGGVLLGGVSWSRANAAETRAVRAILPSATHDTLAVKVLLDTPPSAAPVLTIDGRKIAAQQMDVEGYAWGFVQPDLKGGTSHALTLADEFGAPLRAPWELKTLPGLDERPERFRVLFFTCAGGDEAGSARTVEERRALFDRALSFAPDLAVANGDHIYWDLDTALKIRGDAESRARKAELYHQIAWIDQDTAFDSVTNRNSLNTVIGRQIASIYEDRFASVPLVFISDDHDYFENDNGGTWGYTFPPRPFTLGLQRRTASIAYPFALGRPTLPGGALTSETVETVRIGKLAELALFDCRRGWDTVTGKKGVLFPEVEHFLIERLRQSDASQYIQVPSNPFGWTAGKLGEWYEDQPPAGTKGSDKDFWFPGWFDQHQRLIKALSEQHGRPAITISGDMHASGAKRFTSSGDIDLSANPVEALLAGTVGTGASGWPSMGRGMFPSTPGKLVGTDIAETVEKNGFTLFDITHDHVEVRQFSWRPPEPIEAIASLEPYATFRIERRA